MRGHSEDSTDDHGANSLLWPGDQVTCPHLGKWATAVQCSAGVQVQLWVAAHPGAGLVPALL